MVRTIFILFILEHPAISVFIVKTMAFATATPNLFHKDQAPKERKESFSSSVSNKSLENPLLSRDQPKLVMETPTHGSAFASSFGKSNDINEQDGLRRRRGGLVRFDDGTASNKENSSLFRSSSPAPRPPPRASYSLGTEGVAAGKRMSMVRGFNQVVLSSVSFSSWPHSRCPVYYRQRILSSFA